MGSRRLHGAGDRAVEALDIVGRVLPRGVRILGIEKNARLTAGIIVDVRGDFATIGDIDHQGPHAIGAVIDADGKCRLAILGHDGPFRLGNCGGEVGPHDHGLLAWIAREILGRVGHQGAQHDHLLVFLDIQGMGTKDHHGLVHALHANRRAA